MDPIVQKFIGETLPVVASAAALWGVAAGVVGLLLGLLLDRWLGARGWWLVPGKLAGAARIASMLVCLAVGGFSGGMVGVAVGVRLSAEGALRNSDVGREALPAYGHLSADLLAMTTWWAAQIADPSQPAPQAPSLVERLQAFRESGTEIPLADLEAALSTLAAGIRGPQGDEVTQRLMKALHAGVPPQTVQGVDQGLMQIADAVRGKHTSLPTAQLAWAYAHLPDAAASSGDPAALSREELGKLAADGVMMPIALQAFTMVVGGGALAVVAVSLALFVGYVLLLWIVRRLLTARKA